MSKIKDVELKEGWFKINEIELAVSEVCELGGDMEYKDGLWIPKNVKFLFKDVYLQDIDGLIDALKRIKGGQE